MMCFLRHGSQFCSEWVVDRFQSAFCVIEVSQVIIHEADEPKPVFNLLDANSLARKDLPQVDLAGVEADAGVACRWDEEILSSSPMRREIGGSRTLPTPPARKRLEFHSIPEETKLSVSSTLGRHSVLFLQIRIHSSVIDLRRLFTF
jgi:hypothetical protein